MNPFTYRKKPVVIEAFQYHKDMGEHTMAVPKWFIDACISNIVFAKDDSDYIKTLEGEHIIIDGDYVVKGVKGELYPCKPDIFNLTYEKVTE